jgi:hypothetical protein
MSGVLTTVGVGASPNACWHSAAHHTAAGTPSGLLVSRSATKGTRVFRMQRDDELLRLMLLGERVARSMQQTLMSLRHADEGCQWLPNHPAQHVAAPSPLVRRMQ